ncbi:MAG: hypothetical protein ACRCX2_14060 [Paraclostridium sp.]
MTVKLKKNANVVLVFGNDYTVTRIIGSMDGEEGKGYEVEARPGIFYPASNFISLEAYVDILEGCHTALTTENTILNMAIDDLKGQNAKLVGKVANLAIENGKLRDNIKKLHDEKSIAGTKSSENKKILLHTLSHLKADIEKM